MRAHGAMTRWTIVGPLAALVLACMAVAPANAGAPEISAELRHCDYPTMAPTDTCDEFATVNPDGSVLLWMGSDSGVVCAETRLPDLGEGSNSTFSGFVTLGEPGLFPEALISIPVTSRGELTQDCVSGIDPMLISALFTNPAAYWFMARVSYVGLGVPGCPWECEKLTGQFGFVAAGSETPGGGTSGGGSLPDTAVTRRASMPPPTLLLAALGLLGLGVLARPRAARR